MPTALEYLSDPLLGLVREQRPPQLRMAEHVEKVLAEGGAAFVEAGVATGKTFAYLVPALLARGRRIVVATAKKQLQDQIISKDLPAIAEALGTNLQAALFDASGVPMIIGTARKGNGNYACQVLSADQLVRHPRDAAEFDRFIKRSTFGDRADWDGTPPFWWGEANAEDCVGKRCEAAGNCGFIALKAAVAASKVIVINHHLLGMEMRYGLGKLVGGPYDVLVVDEAHKLGEGIRGAFTTRMSKRQGEQVLSWLSSMTWTTFPRVALFVRRWAEMFERVPNSHWREPHLREAPALGENDDAMDEVFGAVDDAYVEVDKTLSAYGLGDNDDSGSLGEWEPSLQRDLSTMIRARRKLDDLERGLQLAQGKIPPKRGEEPEEYEQRRDKLIKATAIYGMHEDKGGFAIYCSPVQLGGIASSYFSGVKSIVLTSATIAVQSGFGHLEDMTGLKPVVTDVLASPFDYDRQGFVYIPRDTRHVAKPNRKADAEEAKPWRDALAQRVERAVRLVELSDGGAFVLTTANEELDAFATALKRRFPGRTFAQSHALTEWDGDPPSALEKFRAVPDSILVGSKSFWEGVDVPGGALRLVIVAKLPFAQVSDPIVKARERLSDNPFMEIQLTDMLIDLRQGVGRLIRSKSDRGMIAILDDRVWTKRYGGAVLAALPWSRDVVTSDLAVVEKYLPKYAAYFKSQKVA